MKTWADLSKDQQNFISRYLKKGFKDLFRKRHKSETNRAIIAAYGNFADLEALFEEKARGVPDDYVERAAIVAHAQKARDIARTGNFDAAAQVMAPAISLMESTWDALVQDADALRASVAPADTKYFPSDSLPTISAARTEVMKHLSDDLPTNAQMDDAQAALPAYEKAVSDAMAAAGEIPATNLRLDQAKKRAQTKLDDAAALDSRLLIGTTQKAAIDARIDEAKRLLGEFQGIDRKNLTAMRDLTLRIDRFVLNDQLDSLVADATQEIRDVLRARFNLSRARAIAARDADLTEIASQSQHAGLVQLQGELRTGISFIEATLTSDDPAALHALSNDIDALENKSESFETLLDAAVLAQQRSDLDSSGVKPAHVDGIQALQKVNKDAADKVIQSIERNKALLGGQKATPDFVRTKRAEADKLKAERDTLGQESQAASQAYKAEIAAQKAIETAMIKLREQVQAQGTPPTKQQIAQYQQLDKDLKAKKTDVSQSLVKWRAAFAVYDAKRTDLEAASRMLKAAEVQRAMLDAITFGPLSPVAGRPVPANLVEDVVALFDSNPDIATRTCSLVGTAKDPKVLAETALMLANQVNSGFEWSEPPGPNGAPGATKRLNTAQADYYADKLLKQTAYFGSDFADGIAPALQAGIAFEDNPVVRALKSTKEISRARTTEIAQKVMQRKTDSSGKTTVSLDFSDPDFQTAISRQKYGVIGQHASATMVVEEVEKLQAFFDDPTDGAARRQQAEGILNAVDMSNVPVAAVASISTLTGIPEADLRDPSKTAQVNEAVQIAILRSMVTPIAQGSVGSCFATAPLRNVREVDPLGVMEMYKEIATTGEFTPKQGKSFSAIVNFPAGDDPLTRSLEYSVATAGARLAASRERRHANSVLYYALEPTSTTPGLKSKLPKSTWKKFHPELIKTLTSSFTFEYDPLAKSSSVAEDGNSSQGLFRMVDTKAGNEIRSQADFLRFMKAKAIEAATAKGLKQKEMDAVRAYIDDPAFAAVLDKLAGDNKPWDMPSGGYGDEANDALTDGGGHKRSTDLVPADAADSPGKRAEKVLAALAGLATSGGSGMTMISTSGIHAFNALPPTGEFAKLATGNVANNIDSMLVKPGAKIATTPLSKDRCIYLYDKQLERVVGFGRTDPEKALVRAAFANRPNRDMTPAELEAHISQELDAFKAAIAQRKLDDWKAKQKTPPAPVDEQKKKTALRAAEDAQFKNIVARDLVPELGAPEFVVADSNWGDETEHRYFVIAPDPLTGEPRMWQKSVTDGSLWPMEDKWLAANWTVDQ